MRKFEPKPLKPEVDIGLKTPNPEGFGITPKTLRDISNPEQRSRGVSPWNAMAPLGRAPLRVWNIQTLKEPLRKLKENNDFKTCR